MSYILYQKDKKVITFGDKKIVSWYIEAIEERYFLNIIWLIFNAATRRQLQVFDHGASA
jgi:hypothetical protein